MAQFEIGKSSYGDLKGVTQYVNTKRIADQFKSMARDFAAKFGKDGDRLTPNEGMRSRPRQQLLYRNYLYYGGAKAAVPYTSRHDEVTHGNAIDVGVTRADGSNRALTSEEFDWMHSAAESRGFTWTGRYFGEPWHIEGATRAEVYPPFADIVNGGGAVITPAPSTTPPIIHEDDDMTVAVKIKDNGARFQVGFGTLTYFGDGKTVNVAKNPDLTMKVFSTTDELHELTLAQARDLFESCDIPTKYTNPAELLKEQANGRWSLQALAIQQLRALNAKVGK